MSDSPQQHPIAPHGHPHLTWRRGIVLLAIPVCATLGNTLLALGMRHAGKIDWHNLLRLIESLADVRIIAGVILLIGFMAAQLTAFSWADLTYVVPTTSIGYIAIPLISRFFLHERLSTYRWAGIGLIFIGIVAVAGGPSRTKKPGEVQT